MLVGLEPSRLELLELLVLDSGNDGALMGDLDTELREAAERPTQGWARARAFVWTHRTWLAPLVGVLAAKLCPMLGWAAAPCGMIGDVLRQSLVP